MTQDSFDTQVWTLLSQRYKDFVRIGEGATAVVFKAQDSALNRTVAIKTMSISRMTPEMVLRFQHEARAASKLQHPNLIKVLDFGLVENIRPYLVMDYVEGDSLEEFLQKHDYLSVEQTISILLEVCRGMSFAHKNGVVHRDLKPSNILLLDVPTDARVKVVDFGIAKLQDECELLKPNQSRFQESSVRANLERTTGRNSRGRTGELIGSPFYISPEQIKGENVDERSDIYSLGCIMFRMLSGMAPFEGETHLETYSQHLNDLPPRIVEPVVPDALHDLMDRCLAKDPTERPESMDAVADEMRRVLKQAAPADRSSDQAQNHSRRLKRTLFYTVVALVVIGSVIAFAIQSAKSPAPQSVADAKPALVSPSAMSGRWQEEKESEGPVFWHSVSGATDRDVDIISGTRVSNISFRNTQITVAGISKLNPRYVTHLDLTGRKFDDSAAPEIAKLKELRYLNLTGSRMTDSGLLKLAPLRKLERLDLDQSLLISDHGIDNIIKLWPKLLYLNLAKTGVTEKGLLRLKELHNLRALELSELRLSDKVMEELIGLSGLRELNLNHCQFSRKWVMEFPRMPSLQRLCLSQVPGIEPAIYVQLEKELSKRNCQFQCFDNLSNELREVSPLVEFIGN